jgi:hypothetical protein
MTEQKLKYILPILAILLSMTIMQFYCNGADNSSTYFYNFQPERIAYDFSLIKQEKIEYDLVPQTKIEKKSLSELDGNTKISTIKTNPTNNYSINKPSKIIKQRPGIFRRR